MRVKHSYCRPLSPSSAYHTTLSDESKKYMTAAQWYAWQMMCHRIEPGHLLLGILNPEVPATSISAQEQPRNDLPSHKANQLQKFLKAAELADNSFSHVFQSKYITFLELYNYIDNLYTLGMPSRTVPGLSDPSPAASLGETTPSSFTIQLLKHARLLALKQGTDVIHTHHILQAYTLTPEPWESLSIGSVQTHEDVLAKMANMLCENPVASYSALLRALQHKWIQNTLVQQHTAVSSSDHHASSSEQVSSEAAAAAVSYKSQNDKDTQGSTASDWERLCTQSVLSIKMIPQHDKNETNVKALLAALPSWPGLGPGLNVLEDVREQVFSGSGWSVRDRLLAGEQSVKLVLETLNMGVISNKDFMYAVTDDHDVRICSSVFEALTECLSIPDMTDFLEMLLRPSSSSRATVQSVLDMERDYHTAVKWFNTYRRNMIEQLDNNGGSATNLSDYKALFRLAELLNNKQEGTQASYMRQLASCSSTSSFRDLVKKILFGWSHKCSLKGRHQWPPQWKSGGGTDDSSKSLCLTFMYAMSCLQQAEDREGIMTSSVNTLTAEEAVSLLSMMSSIMHSKVTVEDLKEHALRQQGAASPVKVVRGGNKSAEQLVLALEKNVLGYAAGLNTAAATVLPLKGVTTSNGSDSAITKIYHQCFGYVYKHFHTCQLGPDAILTIALSLRHYSWKHLRPDEKWLHAFGKHIIDCAPACSVTQICKLLERLQSFNFTASHLGITEQQVDMFLDHIVGCDDPVIPQSDHDNRLKVLQAVLGMKWPLSARWIVGCTEVCQSLPPSYARTTLLLDLQVALSKSDEWILADMYGIVPPARQMEPCGDDREEEGQDPALPVDQDLDLDDHSAAATVAYSDHNVMQNGTPHVSPKATDSTTAASRTTADSALLAGSVDDKNISYMKLFCTSFAAMYIQQHLAEAAARNLYISESCCLDDLLFMALTSIVKMDLGGHDNNQGNSNQSGLLPDKARAAFFRRCIHLLKMTDADKVKSLNHVYVLVWAVAVLNLQPPPHWINFVWNLLQPDLLASRGNKEEGLKGETTEELKILAAWAFTALQQESSKRALIASLISMPPKDQSLTTLSAALWVYTQYCITQHKPALLSTSTDTAAVYNKITSKAEQQWLHEAANELVRAVKAIDSLEDEDVHRDGLDPHQHPVNACEPAMHYHGVCASGLQCLVCIGYRCPVADCDMEIWRSYCDESDEEGEVCGWDEEEDEDGDDFGWDDEEDDEADCEFKLLVKNTKASIRESLCIIHRARD
ncbi:hypothetical protein CEUSTIGMA_g12919.t1 [Chlamydomonas eustigma]|uniref:Uncharacterized protein n=1 Tax=Chlamydomonas eustigma TaxID=1157962 RepID=A0A250XR49_9CHLO|nr:hypothetical protein CEUSTIGMA_g12919.t1 [Chlamydomonas eustigma]|eukprot:GAX85503.1 hypothetical protein CEUSTIGMA_g12919.t1 [Chlamydomonas eustigma]